jgi:hypothetical protein
VNATAQHRLRQRKRPATGRSREALAAPHVEQVEELLRAGDGLVGAFEFQPVIARDKARAEFLLHEGQVGLVAAIELPELAGVGEVEGLCRRHGAESGKQ